MKYRIGKADKDVTKLVKELSPVFSKYGDNEERTLQLNAGRKNGFTASRDQNVITIEYAAKTDLCRALLMASVLKDGHECSGTCSFEDFGYMHDCSRNAVPTVDTVKGLIRVLALMGYNYLGLYTEDTMKVRNEPYFGYMRGAYSEKEIKDMAEYAEIFGMELRPYIQTLAHLNQILRYQQYADFSDCDDIMLAEDERTYKLLDHIIGTAAACYKTKHINIGLDEAHMVGLGQYLDKHGYCDRFQIMSRHLDRVNAICSKYGLKPQMWSDMFFRLAFGGNYYVDDASIKDKVKIPEGVQLAYWDYYSTDEAHYIKMLRQHKQISENPAFAGGAWRWTGFTPHNAYSLQIGKAAMSACVKEKVNDVVITGWGDDGAETAVYAVLPALYDDASAAWCADRKIYDDAFSMLAGMRFDDFMKIDLANPYPDKTKTHNNAGKYFLYNDPLIGTFDSVVTKHTAQYYADTDKMLRACIKKYPDSGYAYIFRTQETLCKVLTSKADLGCRIRTAYADMNGKVKMKSDRGKIVLRTIADSELPAAIRDTEKFYRIFSEQWHLENKNFGWEVQTIRIGGLIQRLKDVKVMLDDYLDGKTDHIDELDEKYLKFNYFSDSKPESLDFNRWTETASTGRFV